MDGSAPGFASILYNGLISISSTTMLRFVPVDNIENSGNPANNQIYKIDTGALSLKDDLEFLSASYATSEE